MPPLLTLSDVHLTFGGTPLFEGANLQIDPSDRIGLVGRNGSGKSTLLKIAAGQVEPDSGDLFVKPGTRVTYLAQEPDLSAFPTTLAFTESAFGEHEDPYRARVLLNELDLTGDEDPTTLSGGQVRRAALAQALALEPDVLLLDEPTNHLDLTTIEWLETTLSASNAAMVLISHDRAFLTMLTSKTVWVDRGQTRDLDKGFSAFEAWRDKYLEEEALERHKLDRKIKREEHWMHGGVTARRKRNVRRVAELAGLRAQKLSARPHAGTVRLQTSDAEQSGKLVIEARNLGKGYEGAENLVKDFSLRIARGDRLALAGPNGSGKTTLLKLLIGQLEPDSGSVRLGTNLETVTLEQNRETLISDVSISDTLTGGRGDSVIVNGQSRHVTSYLKDFLFQPEQLRTPVSALSGGERARLMLARALAQPSNLLVLDEPTNDLDLETLDLLQELVSEYPGTVILISHDRDFLDRTATSILIPEGSGKWTEYAGGYSDMLLQRGALSLRTDHKPPPEPKTEPARSAAPDLARRSPRKLSFKDKHALETLPVRIDEIEAEIVELTNQLADPDLFSRDPDAFTTASSRLSELQTAKEAAEERWLALEMLREAIEG